ncbi:MAG: vanadium-dependent haloperoxidase [Acidobacteria bacterium]|nr:vanadium-dependent haloperoxidase [Acidobacteriota bacterium]MBI3426732.1 vanadium-dependent haloperoxidase [Acidobacteriota bacterium]
MKRTRQNQYEQQVRELLTRSRREFLREAGGLTAAALAAGAGVPVLAQEASTAQGLSAPADFGGVTGVARAAKVYEARVQAATFQKIQPLPEPLNNGDEDRYANRLGNFSKALPHNNLGEVDAQAYNSLLNALKTASPDDFERITLGGSVKLTNPQAGLGMDMEGPDTMHLNQPAAPTFNSAEEAGEIAENYWMALLRDVAFADYDTSTLAVAAVTDLNRFSDFRGARISARTMPTRGGSAGVADEGAAARLAAEGEAEPEPQNLVEPEQNVGRVPQRAKALLGRVTTGTLFRGLTPGDLTGPYLSQFMWLEAPFGAETISRRMRTVNPGVDYLTTYSAWLSAQNGNGVFSYSKDPTPRYIRNGRDLAEWVHIDVLFQAYFTAMLILLGSGAPFDKNNPYAKSNTQNGFGTFGPPHIAALVCEVATRALKAVWFQKWFVHRRLRPEEFAGRLHNHVTRAAVYPIHADILSSPVLTEVNRKYGTYLLPMAFPEGCPTHPAYGAGHATVAGACVTILKAWFDEAYVIPNPVIAAPDGLTLLPYTGAGAASLTVGGELNKLASNVAIGRNIAGVHWRSDATESLKLGEAVAIGLLQDFKGCFNEKFDGFSLTKFDGTRVLVG